MAGEAKEKYVGVYGRVQNVLYTRSWCYL